MFERRATFLALAVGAAVVASCAQEQHPESAPTAPAPTTDASADAGIAAAITGPRTCVQAQSSPLPARLVARSAQASSAATVVLVDDVFAAFINACGQCHGPTSGMGSFQLATVADFKTGMNADVLAHATSDESVNPRMPSNPNDPLEPMPPYGSSNFEAYSKRDANDPVVVFVKLTQEWFNAKRANSFTLTEGQADGGQSDGGAALSTLTMTPVVGDAMTNLGDCIPGKGLVGIEETVSAQLDAMFAGLRPKDSGSASDVIGLPEHLAQTDLFTLDSRVLAQYGVIAYAPAYPLWSDDAGKLRYVRVPRGTSIKFDKATQQFIIPANTRFYKTFMKQIIDTDNSIRWRKIETRLILSRPDNPGEEGDEAHNALYATYRWNDSETDATLVDTPLRDGTIWNDTILEYNTDEPLAAQLRTNPNATEETLIESKAARHYAIPSSDRCNECHLGSVSRSYVLGFSPVQINRRPTGQGGTIEPTGPDEATQLQRFIDYGLVTGIDSLDDVLPLEKLEGSRSPRNDHELTAQGYFLGNCSHCHNPRGDPSVENPVLKQAFNLYPSPDGGIFQWSLERYSPRIFRGNGGTTQMPYITPSLMDYPRFDPVHPTTPIVDALVASDENPGPPPTAFLQYAPWRSLLYRNVDTAFSYTDDEALMPHMPRNTAGFDNRLPRIASDWMVSIPSVLKHPEGNEYALTGLDNGQPDMEEQPYVEVLPGDPRYPAALAAASARLEILHDGTNPAIGVPTDVSGNPVTAPAPPRYQQDRNIDDIVDPATLRDPVCSPVPTGILCPAGSSSSVCDPPNHPQYTALDTSNPAVYAPRRTDWIAKLVQQQPDTLSGCGGASQPANISAHQDEEDAVSLLQTVTLDPTFRDFATKKVPFAFWQKKPGCDFSSQPTAGSLTGSGGPRWSKVPHVQFSPTDPVYSQSPGAAVYKSICINCHGSIADGGGRLSKNLAEMTGGLARPADFRDGLFGPVGATADMNNRHAAFGMQLPSGTSGWSSINGVPVTDDDRAARYLSWMALGGTQVLIPPPILQIVSLTRVLGTRRPYFPAAQPSANMLSTAKLLCETVLGSDSESPFNPQGIYSRYIDQNPEFIGTNGDAETWFKLCTMGHAAPVHVINLSNCTGHLCEPQVLSNGALQPNLPLLDPATFPAGVTVGDPAASSGYESTLTPDNPWPWCVQPRDYLSGQDAIAYIQAQGWPLCPQGATGWHAADASRWATRGAINAGLAVYLYLSGLEQMSAADPDYDQCDLLGAGGDQ